MAKAGLLILTSPLSQLKSLLPRVIEEASVVVSDTLYVCLQPAVQNPTLSSFIQPVSSTQEVKQFISGLYLSGSNVCHTLDIRVLLSHLCKDPSIDIFKPYSVKKEITVWMTDSTKLKDLWQVENVAFIKALQNAFTNISFDSKFHFINVGQEAHSSSIESSELLKTFPNVVVGGTFDRLHNGHKSLLTECCMRCDNKLTVGITDGERNKKKTLWELMEPFSDRKAAMANFVSDVKPSISLEPVQIFDPFGPTITDPDFQCIVVSEETKAGGGMVNEERKKRNFKELEMVVIDLVDDACRADDEEEKVSSSSKRKRLLGTLIKPLPSRPNLSKSPYRIAVTGGIASGKSNVCSELEKLGAKVINCDLLGHKAYDEGTAAYQAIVKEFGQKVVDEDGKINRKQLGAIVFADRANLDKLNSIVWPAIRQLAEEAIAQHKAGCEQNKRSKPAESRGS
ncbi:bifunctional coenzyme A synthase isoform X2 [Aplysia californica]|uniref:Bifunctional coenzyme A synthase isoform X2 n=1 Tax=Aplysia californica TaxID=6500 RepID=A0ABM0JA56_APLCA|nr:bifunctional coenzyme A synthase isoform X2 [Aplysia californica]